MYLLTGMAVRCLYSVLVMHRRTDLWGPDGTILIFPWIHAWLTDFLALVFDPDRFLDERLKKYLTPNPFIFCPFNAGPRICLGQQVYIQTTHALFIPHQHFFFHFLVCLSWSYLLPCSSITGVHWICFRQISEPSTSCRMGRLWRFEGDWESLPRFASDYVRQGKYLFFLKKLPGVLLTCSFFFF